jgi:hypothetical protein
MTLNELIKQYGDVAHIPMGVASRKLRGGEWQAYLRRAKRYTAPMGELAYIRKAK